jgi:tetratricopeptide (TPR) repeat protein
MSVWLLVAAATACSADSYSVMLKHAANGDAYGSAGKLEEAIIEYRNALQAEPRAGAVRVKLAEVYFRHGEPGKGLDEYVRAADILPDPGLQLKTGSLLLAARRFDEAKVRAQNALNADPKNLAAQILLANALAGLKDLDGAVAELQQAIEWDPDHSQTYTSLGSIELGRGNQKSAEQAFKRAVELAPQSAASHLALGSYYWSTAQWTEAARELNEAVRVEPDNAFAHRTAATFYIATNRRDIAEAHLRRDLDITKSTAAAIALADYYVLEQKPEAARQTLEPLTKDPETLAVANTRLAVLDQATGHPAEAARRLDDVLRKEPTQLTALVIRSRLLLSQGKKDEALKVAKAATEAHSEAASAFSALGRVHVANGNIESAMEAFREAIRLNPLATDAQIALARLELASGGAQASVSLAQDALKAEPQNPEARLALVKGLIARGELERAQIELKTLIERFPNSAAVHTANGMLLGRQKKAIDARHAFERALQLRPDSLEAIGGLVALVDELSRKPAAAPPALMMAARIYAATGDPKMSEQLLRRVVTTDPSYLPAYAALGQVYAKQGRLDAAVAEFEALAQRDSKPVGALTMIGILLEAQGKSDAARERYERVIELNGSAPVAANNLAWIYAQSNNKLDRALELAQTARQGLPMMAEVSDTLGFVYYKKGLLSLAIDTLQTAVRADEGNPGYRYHLGLALAKSGEKAAAAQHLERALALKPDFDGSADAREQLKSLRTP